MNARFDGRGYLADPRDPHATPPQELFVVAREGGTPRQLTTQGVNVEAPSWRADSRALVFTSNMFQRDEYIYERSDLFTVELEGPVRRVTDDGFDHSAPIWAADGSIVALREQSLNQILAAKQTVRVADGPLPLSRRRWRAREPDRGVGLHPGHTADRARGPRAALHGRRRRLHAAVPRAAHRRGRSNR